jgi:hypothetical protein
VDVQQMVRPYDEGSLRDQGSFVVAGESRPRFGLQIGGIPGVIQWVPMLACPIDAPIWADVIK